MSFDLSVVIRPESEFLDGIYREIKTLQGWRKGGVSGVENTNVYYVIDVLSESISGNLYKYVYKQISQIKDSFEIEIKNFSVQANAYAKDFKGSIHNDFDYENNGYPTHRALVQFKNKNLEGGELIFYKKVIDQPHEFAEFLRISNENHTEIMFQITPESFHGISRITEGSRISLLINIWDYYSQIPKNFLDTAWMK